MPSLSRFDLPAFYKECRRILKPTGTLAAWGYGLCEFPGNSKANALLHHYYTDVVGPYWDDRRRFVDEQYKGELCAFAPPTSGYAVFCFTSTQMHEYTKLPA